MKLKCPISLLLYVAERPFSLYFQWKYFLFNREKEREKQSSCLGSTAQFTIIGMLQKFLYVFQFGRWSKHILVQWFKEK